ncbi:GNAT family N-acetyltransferase [Candidatus Zixiibacteriota bacterium]
MQTLVFDSSSLPEKRWSALCDRAEAATIFHQSIWSRLWEKVRRDARAEWHILTDDHGKWIGGLPLVRFTRLGINRLYSQPLGSYGGWIGQQLPEHLDAVSGLLRQLRRPTVAEFVITPYVSADPIGYPGRKIERQRYALDLSAEGDNGHWSTRLRPDMARNLKTAQQHGWRIDVVESIADVLSQQNLWAETVARHGRTFDPVRWKLYQLLVEHCSIGRQLFWWTATDDRGPAATMICFHSADRFFYFDGAMDLDRKDGRPMFVLFAQALNTARELGCRIFDFGSGPKQAAGLARFKEGWGARAETYYEYHFRRAWWPKR